MTRSEFIRMCAYLGIGIPFRTSSASNTIDRPNASTKVIIVGSGAAGLTTAYLLKQQGIDSVILEASDQFGGRMKRTKTFADFPIPLGAEWLHTHPRILEQLVNDPKVDVKIETTAYDAKVATSIYKGHRITLSEAGFDNDYKFINATWFDFFERYILPAVSKQIQYASVVESIDYSKSKAVVATKHKRLSADKVVVTVPVKMLQSKSIKFKPQLPASKQRAISQCKVWNGCKAFVEFSKSFYPTFTAFEIVPEKSGQKLYYDASYGQRTSKHILGLFAVGSGAEPYQKQRNDDELIKFVLKDLDELFDNQASKNYVKHIFHDWNKVPFIEGAYLYDHESWLRARVLGQSVGDKLFFAGEAYSNGENWGGVDAAISSAKRAVTAIVRQAGRHK